MSALTSKQVADEGFVRSQEALLSRLLTISSAALTLSIAFKTNLAGPDPKFTELLTRSWMLFLVVIVLSLLSFYCGYFIAKSDHDWYAYTATHPVLLKTANAISFLAVQLCFWSFIAGIILLTAFAALNTLYE